MKIIARMQSDFPSKFGIPRQSGRVPELQSRIIFEPEFRNPDAVRGIEAFNYIWVLWEFSEAKRENWSATVRPPRLGGNERVGVFASRSPFRPNPVGLSSVRLDRVEMDAVLGPVLYVSGADLMDGTPIYDIKPYIGTDIHMDAVSGYSDETRDHRLEVCIPDELLRRIPEDKREALKGILAEDPVPGYQKDPERIYGLTFGKQNIRFRISSGTLTVCEVVTIS